jgi:hypothetical protein
MPVGTRILHGDVIGARRFLNETLSLPGQKEIEALAAGAPAVASRGTAVAAIVEPAADLVSLNDSSGILEGAGRTLDETARA